MTRCRSDLAGVRGVDRVLQPQLAGARSGRLGGLAQTSQTPLPPHLNSRAAVSPPSISDLLLHTWLEQSPYSLTIAWDRHSASAMAGPSHHVPRGGHPLHLHSVCSVEIVLYLADSFISAFEVVYVDSDCARSFDVVFCTLD